MKRSISLLLMLLLLVSLASCAQSEPTTDSAGTTTTTTDSTTDATDSTGDIADESGEEATAITFPLAETFTFDFWLSLNTNYYNYTSLTEHPAYTELANRTNVVPNYITPSSQAAAEQFSLITAGGDYYDVMQMASTATNLSELLENEIAIELTEQIPTYMPNYYGIIEANTALQKDVSDDDHRMIGIFSLQDEPTLNWSGMGIRKDLLDEAGVALPTTYDEWDTALAALLAAGCERPLSLPKGGYFTFNNMESGFGVSVGFYQDAGQVKYGPMEDGYLEYLTLMNDWYEKDYIGGNFAGDDERYLGLPTIADIADGTVGACFISSSELGDAFAGDMSGNEDFYIAALPNPVKGSDSRIWSTSGGSAVAGQSFFVSSQCPEESVPVILSYFDYLYSEEGWELVSWGVQGDSFDFDENGERYYTDRVDCSLFDNVNTFHVYGLTFFGHPGLYNDKERYLGRPDEIVEMQSNWTRVGTDLGVLPTLTFTAEETETYSGIASDCNTYVQENIVQFIIGGRPLSEFDDFRESLRSMGIDTALEVYQAAYDRYNAR